MRSKECSRWCRPSRNGSLASPSNARPKGLPSKAAPKSCSSCRGMHTAGTRERGAGESQGRKARRVRSCSGQGSATAQAAAVLATLHQKLQKLQTADPAPRAARPLTSTGPLRRGCIALCSAADTRARSRSVGRPRNTKRAGREPSWGSVTSTARPPRPAGKHQRMKRHVDVMGWRGGSAGAAWQHAARP